jgi:hypothetical protein
MNAATITGTAVAAVLLLITGCGGSPLSNKSLSGEEIQMLTEAGGRLGRHLAFPPDHPEWREALPDSVTMEIVSLARRVPSTWGVLYRAASDTVSNWGITY